MHAQLFVCVFFASKLVIFIFIGYMIFYFSKQNFRQLWKVEVSHCWLYLPYIKFFPFLTIFFLVPSLISIIMLLLFRLALFCWTNLYIMSALVRVTSVKNFTPGLWKHWDWFVVSTENSQLWKLLPPWAWKPQVHFEASIEEITFVGNLIPRAWKC